MIMIITTIIMIITIMMIIPAAMAITAPTSVLSTSFVNSVISGVVVKPPDLIRIFFNHNIFSINFEMRKHLWKRGR